MFDVDHLEPTMPSPRTLRSSSRLPTFVALDGLGVGEGAPRRHAGSSHVALGRDSVASLEHGTVRKIALAVDEQALWVVHPGSGS